MYEIINPSSTVTPVVVTPYGTNANNAKHEHQQLKIFLAGSIQMDLPESWHVPTAKKIAAAVAQLAPNKYYLRFINPTQKGAFNDALVHKQIVWEQTEMLKADYIFMYLDGAAKSPISLLEFGEYIASGKLYVCCDPDFYKRANLEGVVQVLKQEARLFANFPNAIQALAQAIAQQD